MSTKIIFNVSCPNPDIQGDIYRALRDKLSCLLLRNSDSDEWYVNRERMQAEISSRVQSGPYLANGFFTEPFICLQRDMNSAHEKEYFDFIDSLGPDIRVVHIHIRSDTSRNEDRRTSLLYLYSKLIERCRDDDERSRFRNGGWVVFDYADPEKISGFVTSRLTT